MIYRYLYQDKTNTNREGEIVARSRDEAYALLRKQGIRPYRVIGNDPWNWRPWVIAVSYAVLLIAIAVLAIILTAKIVEDDARKTAKIELSVDEAESFRRRAENAVMRAPEAYRYNVWKGVNARLEERGLEPIPKPADLMEEE